MSAELLPCPLCNKEAGKVSEDDYVFAFCKNDDCPFNGFYVLLSKWNTRSPSAQPSLRADECAECKELPWPCEVHGAQPTGKPIQRWAVDQYGEEYEWDDGAFVLYADHQAQLAEAVAELAQARYDWSLTLEGHKAEVERLRQLHADACFDRNTAQLQRDEALALAELRRKALEKSHLILQNVETQTDLMTLQRNREALALPAPEALKLRLIEAVKAGLRDAIVEKYTPESLNQDEWAAAIVAKLEGK